MNDKPIAPLTPTKPLAPRRGRTGVLLDLSSGPAKVTSPKAQADIVFVIDTTGSMSDKIEGLLQTCRKFVDQLAKKRIDWRIAVVAFGDLTVPGDKIEATGFSESIEAIRRSLTSVPRNDGGGNEGESSLEALEKALGLKGYRQTSIKLFILVTDEPALQRRTSPAKITATLRTRRIVTFVVSPALNYFQDMAKQTGGEWFRVASDTDFTSVLALFDKVTGKVAHTIERIQLEAGGDIGRFLRLAGPQN